MNSDTEDNIQLDDELDTQIRPVIQPIFEQILSCYDKKDESLKPFAECIQSKVVYLARQAIHYVQTHPQREHLEHNKLYVRNLIRKSAQDCIQNGNELGLDTSRWQAMFQCIMGGCEQYIDLLINLLMRNYEELMNRALSGVSTKSKHPSSHRSPSRQSPQRGLVRRSPLRQSPRRSPIHLHRSPLRLSPRSTRLSPRNIRASPRNARLSPRHNRLSPRNARASPRNSHLSPRRYNSMTLSRR
jgi:hypothetical protein